MKVNDWCVSAPPEILAQRAQILALLRKFFEHRKVLEVEVPSFSRFKATDPYTASIEIISQHYQKFYLQTSPEGWLKAYISEFPGQDVFTISRAFRDDIAALNHLPEFTMLEWYRHHFDWRNLCREVIQLIQAVEVDTTSKAVSIRHNSYAELLHQSLNQRNMLTPNWPDFSACQWFQLYQQLELPEVVGVDANADSWQQLVWTELVEANFTEGIQVVYDFPANQRLFAELGSPETNQANSTQPIQLIQPRQVAKRFEIYWNRLEIANGWQEVTNAEELKRIMQQQQSECLDRRMMGLDQTLISGVAVGLDRLICQLLNKQAITDVTGFQFGLLASQ